MGSKSWGTPLTAKQYVVVGENEEIPLGEYAYVFNRDSRDHSVIGIPQWERFLEGNLAEIKNSIEQGIPNTKVQWINISWDSAELKRPYPEYWVYGFRIEALVKNESGAALTGAEIYLIIIAIAFLALVIAGIALGAWVTWRVMSAAEQLGPIATVGVGLAILLGICILLFVAIGGKGEYRGKKRRFRIGKG